MNVDDATVPGVSGCDGGCESLCLCQIPRLLVESGGALGAHATEDDVGLEDLHAVSLRGREAGSLTEDAVHILDPSAHDAFDVVVVVPHASLVAGGACPRQVDAAQKARHEELLEDDVGALKRERGLGALPRPGLCLGGDERGITVWVGIKDVEDQQSLVRHPQVGRVEPFAPKIGVAGHTDMGLMGA